MAGPGSFVRDLRHSLRSLLRDRASVAPAVLALSLGIGATTVVFSVIVDAFPFAHSARVVHFYIMAPGARGASAWYPAPEFAVSRIQVADGARV
jgi:hypothetical protein